MNIYNIRQILKTKSIYDIELRVAYYARVSTDKEEQKNSIINQRSHFEEMIANNKKWKLCGGYVDDGISGIHAEKREEFQRMLQDARDGKIDLIITKEISRFARNTLDSIQYTRELLSYGVCVWFQNDNINTIDDDSEFRLTIMAGVAQDEVRKLSSRVRFGHAQSIKNGVVLGNSHIYGYNKEKGRLTVNVEEAAMVRIIFNKYATGDWSTPKLENHLFELGYRNYKGGKISRGVIQHIITNPKYKGYYAGGKVKIIDMFTKKQEFIPEEDWTMFKDDGSRVPAIVDETTWELANKLFRERSDAIKKRRTSFKNGNTFTGKIFCGNDNAVYWMKQHHVRGKEDVKWVCSHRIKNGAASCNSFGVAESELKSMLASIIRDYSAKADDVTKLYVNIYKNTIVKRPDPLEEITRNEKLLKTLRNKMEKILDYNLSGVISDAEFTRRNKEYARQADELENQIEQLKHKPDTDEIINDKLKKATNLLKNHNDISADDINRSLVEEFIEKIVIYPEGNRKARIEFHLKTGCMKMIKFDKSMCRSGNIFFTIYPPTEPFCLEVRSPL